MSPALGGLGAYNTASTMRISDDTYTISQLFKLVKTYNKNFKPKLTSAFTNEQAN